MAFAAAAMAGATVAPEAFGSVTVGQLSNTPSGSVCGNQGDFAQLSVTSGNSYVIPGNGTISSWTTLGSGGPAQRTFKVFRKVAAPFRYQVVGLDGPRSLTPGGTAGNTFQTTIRVKSGDLIGFETASMDSCYFDSPGSQYLVGSPPLADDQQGDLTAMSGERLELEAVFVPDNTFRVAGVVRHRKKGNAVVSFALPNPGNLTGRGSGAKVSIARTGPVGGVQAPDQSPSALLVKAAGKKLRTLQATGRAKLRLSVTYTPSGGDARTESVKVKLRKG